jgi:soluble lytic murein transglycosylase-like protein
MDVARLALKPVATFAAKHLFLGPVQRTHDNTSVRRESFGGDKAAMGREAWGRHKGGCMAVTLRLTATAAASLLAMTALPAAAQPHPALSAHDVTLYAAAFDAAEHGDKARAEAALAQVSDDCLAGKVRYLEITRSHGASYQELADWLTNFSDTPGASAIYELALKLKPSAAPPPKPAATTSASPDFNWRTTPARESHAAREAYFSGDVGRALNLARAAGDAWIAGLSAYRLGQYPDAMVAFETLAANPSEHDGMRAAGGVWAAKAAAAAGIADRAPALLKIAADYPDTFYGMIAQRALELSDDPLGRLIETVTTGGSAPAAPGESALDRLVRTDPHAHRAAALVQLQRLSDAEAETREGLAGASDDQTRSLWMTLRFELNLQPQTNEIVLHARTSQPAPGHVYPTPPLQPENGFVVDKALVYAVIWQESRFNDLAVSPVGALGLMQLMPPSAANMAGDPSLAADPIILFDTKRNLALGQAYLQWLEQNAAQYDLLRTIAAYNGGPSTLARTEALLGPGADSLLVIESMPAPETRAYVRKVTAAYWSYRRQFGAPTRTLDAVASGAQLIDARLDGSGPVKDAQPTTASARQPLEILLRRSG